MEQLPDNYRGIFFVIFILILNLNTITMRKLLFPLLLVLFTLPIFGQDHFLVELENRSPDILSLVRGYEGYPSIPFQATDINGTTQDLLQMRNDSKTVVLWFWNLDCPKCFEQIDALNLLQEKYKESLQIVSFADDSKEALLASANDRPIGFPIIPNSKTLADGPYGGDLGYPRIFMIDEYGIVKWVFPQQVMKQNFDAFNVLETLHVQLQK